MTDRIDMLPETADARDLLKQAPAEPPSTRCGDLTAAEAAEAFNRAGQSGLSMAETVERLTVKPESASD